MKTKITGLILSYFLLSNSYSQTWEWAKAVYDTNGYSYTQTNAGDVLIDSAGFIYSLVKYRNPSTFSSCFINPVQPGTMERALIKYDSDGNCIWSIQKAGAQIIGMGKQQKYIFIRGNSVDGPINGCPLDSGSFIAKYDYNGNCVFAKTILQGSGNFTSSEAIDTNDNFYLPGEFSDTIQLDTITLTPSNQWNTFYAKFNKNGSVIWTKRAKMSAGFSLSRTDDYGNFYGYGGFGDTLKIDNFSLINTGTSDFFVAKFNENGDVLWIKHIKDSAGNGEIMLGTGKKYVYIGVRVGTSFESDCDSGGTTGELLILKYDTSGSCIWHKLIPAFGIDEIIEESTGNIVLVGGAISGTDLGGCINDKTLIVALLDSSGACLNIASAGPAGCWDAGIDDNKNIYLAGMVIAPEAMFGNDTIKTAGAVNYNTGYIAKLSGLITDTPPAKMQRKGLFIFPNPAQHKYTLVIPEELPLEGMFIRVFDSTGRLAMEESAYSHQQTLDMWGYPKGLYLVRVNVGTVDYVGNIVIE